MPYQYTQTQHNITQPLKIYLDQQHPDYFYPRDAMLARVIAITTCLSVRPSRARIVSKEES